MAERGSVRERKLHPLSSNSSRCVSAYGRRLSFWESAQTLLLLVCSLPHYIRESLHIRLCRLGISINPLAQCELLLRERALDDCISDTQDLYERHPRISEIEVQSFVRGWELGAARIHHILSTRLHEEKP